VSGPPVTPITWQALCDGSDEAFVERLASVFEHAPWVAVAVLNERPFASLDALHAAMMARLRALPEPQLLGLLQGHPDLAGDQARAGAMTADSVAEQGSLALEALPRAEAARWDAMNAAYRERFGFPFVVCAREHTKESILRVAAERLEHTRDEEVRVALEEIAKIARLRLEDLE
jgi:2-oxo-4-hydroxy-4-carboxy-5-ureidoimidazoline decarboxylase